MSNKFTDAEYEALVEGLSLRFPSFGNVGQAAYKPGLERVGQLLATLGNPQNSFSCIHVAGTNGKGSTCNMLAAHFAARGLKVGLYTSPHILDFRERARLIFGMESCLVPKDYVFKFLSDNLSLFEDLGVSYFEITTALAFCWFASVKSDLVVVETGLGGRLDATNVVKPVLSVITNIGYDHMDILGNTLRDIAGEKAGIIKEGVPVVVGEDCPETRPVFESVACGRRSPLYFAGESGTECAGVAPAEFESLLRSMDLQGFYQRKNLKTVLCALDVLGQKAEKEAIGHAAQICSFHGRWEKLKDNPCVICDIGHNAHGLKYNFAQLDSMLDSGEYSDLVMVYGSVRDKDVDAVLRILPSRAYIFYTAASNPRALPADELSARASLYRSAKSGNTEVIPSVEEAVNAALERCSYLKRPLLYIGGSTYVVSEAVKSFGHLITDCK